MKIGLTGGIAMGKSTVVSQFRELGVETASADEFAREVFESESCQRKISEKFGLQTPIDRAELRKILATDENARKFINSVMHPDIIVRIRQSDAQIVEVPLLIESCLQYEFDQVWVVDCPLQVQIERLSARLGDEDTAKSLISVQIPAQVRKFFADEIIRTEVPVSDVFEMSRGLVHAFGLV